MNHVMKLNAIPFDEIKGGLKTAETRLLDEKRKIVSIGDTITFFRLPDKKESVTVKVLRVSVFSSWVDLVKKTDIKDFGPRCKSKKDWIFGGSGYSKEKESNFKNVAFDIKLI